MQHSNACSLSGRAKGFYRRGLQEQLANYQTLCDAVSKLTGELDGAKVQKNQLSDDTGLDLSKLQNSLARLNDTINALGVRLVAKQAERETQRRSLEDAVRAAKRELSMQWHAVRDPLTAKIKQALKALLDIDDFKVRELVGSAHAIQALDRVCDCHRGSLGWPSGNEESHAPEVELRFARLEEHLKTDAYHNYLTMLDRVIGG